MAANALRSPDVAAGASVHSGMHGANEREARAMHPQLSSIIAETHARDLQRSIERSRGGGRVRPRLVSALRRYFIHAIPVDQA